MPFILHLCCADCLLRYLVVSNYDLPSSCQGFYRLPKNKIKAQNKLPLDLHLFFYNPNIYPKSEYQARLQAVKKLAQILSLPLTIADYQPQDYFNLPACQQQLSTTELNSERCLACQKLRLVKTWEFVQQNFPQSNFSTTMLASHYLDQTQIKTLGQKLSPLFQIPKFYYPITQIKTSGFFKQNYCGCLFSLWQKSQTKYLHSNFDH